MKNSPPRKFRGRNGKMAVNWRCVESRTQARSPSVESQSRIERVRNNGRSCYARRSCGRCPDYKRIAFFFSPLPLPRSRCKKQEGRTRDRRRGGWRFSARNKAETIRSIEFTSRLWLVHWLPFPHWPVEGRKGRKGKSFGWFFQRLCEVKAVLSHCSSRSIRIE